MATGPTAPFGPAAGRLRDHATRGALWSMAAQWSVRATGLLTFVVLARLLLPEDFGAIALATSLLLLLTPLVDFGTSTYLVQDAEPGQRVFSTAFWMSATTGAVLATGLVAGSAKLSALLGAPEAAPVIAAVSLSLFLDSLKTTASAVLKRRFEFRALATRFLIAVVLGQVVAMLMAFGGAGVWALVGQVWTVSVVSLAMTWAAARWLPSFEFSRQLARQMARFGVPLVASRVIGSGSTWVTTSLVSRGLGLAAVGYYSMGNRVVQMIVESVGQAAREFSPAMIASVKGDRDRVVNAYLRGKSVVVALMVPPLLALAINAPLLISPVLGVKWEPVVPVLQLLALGGVARVAGWTLSSPLLLALGRPRMQLFAVSVHAVLAVSVTIVTAQISVVAVAAGIAAVLVLVAPVPLLQAGSLLGLPLRKSLGRTLWLTLLGVLAAAPAAVLARVLADQAHDLVVAALALITQAAVQLLLLRLLARPVWDEIVGIGGLAIPRTGRASRGESPPSATVPALRRDGRAADHADPREEERRSIR